MDGEVKNLQNLLFELSLWPMTNWLKGLVAGALTTLLGFGFTMLWDTHKFRRELKQRDEAVFSVIKEEVMVNINILKGNQTVLQYESTILDEKKIVVRPINLLQNSSWDVVKINLPQKLKNDVETLKNIREISQLIDGVNESIRSREIYRIHNGAMSNYFSRIKIYNQILFKQHEDLLRGLEELNLSPST